MRYEFEQKLVQYISSKTLMIMIKINNEIKNVEVMEQKNNNLKPSSRQLF